MLNKEIEKAEGELAAQLAYINSQNLNDSLYRYPYYIGKIELAKSNAKTASAKAETFIKTILSKTKNPTTHYQALINLADFYDDIGNNTRSLELTKSALTIVEDIKNATPEAVGKVQYNVGATLLSLGTISEAKSYFQRALKNFESDPKTSKGQLSDGYNAVGATMWMSSKLDSAKYYYNQAVKTIESADGKAINNLYLSTVIKSNISLLEYTQGNLEEAVNIQNKVISNYEKVIKEHTDENTVSKAKRFQARAISNLAVFYNEQGNLKKAYDILVYANEKKKKLLEATDASLGTGLIQIGQSELSLREYDDALINLKAGLAQLEHSNDNNPYWKAAGKHAMAEIYSAQHKIPLAKQYYEESELLFKEALENDYDTEFLSFLRNKAVFLAENGAPKQALDITTNAYDYILKNGGEDNFDVVKQMLNLAEINYLLKDYDQTLNWIQKTNDYLNKSASVIDSLQTDFNKPQLILLKASAEYDLRDTKDSLFLKQQLQELDKATAILEKRKTTIYKNEDINILLSEYQDITSLSKKLTLELYEVTKNPKYLNQIMKLHESGIYNRIRSRLNLRNNVGFTDVPKKVLSREIALKSKMAATLENTDEIKSFFEANNQWKSFLDSLKQQQPKYYKMRYGTIEKSLDQLQNNVPKETTIVRYIFIEDVLYAFVITDKKTALYKLNFDKESKDIQDLADNHLALAQTSDMLLKLYQQLWEPFEKTISTEKIIVIPDGPLFNLSFETLTPKKIKTYSEMATNSLLAKFIISYNYSLLLLQDKATEKTYANNFVGFAPEFNATMKQNYQIAIRDSLTLDKTYLTLLPQPFTKDLAKNASQLFSGTSFLNENSTEHIFKNSAKEHKIIHIGTHAESNNVSPELSRLVFAKSLDSTDTDDNYLYTYEIYNTNLSSNLAILTACETGKPTYQAGEGMISLAHAFNYAGSESILTSLWKIDEQSSAKIIESFYKYIKKGWAKDKALQQAKLDYIATAEGRTANPQYWAGLVLIGDASPIEMTSSINWSYWMVAVVLLLLLIFIFYKRKSIFRKINVAT